MKTRLMTAGTAGGSGCRQTTVRPAGRPDPPRLRTRQRPAPGQENRVRMALLCIRGAPGYARKGPSLRTKTWAQTEYMKPASERLVPYLEQGLPEGRYKTLELAGFDYSTSPVAAPESAEHQGQCGSGRIGLSQRGSGQERTAPGLYKGPEAHSRRPRRTGGEEKCRSFRVRHWPRGTEVFPSHQR